MKAVLTDDRFSDPDWIYERKLDGIRCLTFRTGDGVRLMSRNQLSLNHRFPELADALGRGPAEFVADGEVVAFAGAQTSFAKLQQRGERHVAVFLYVFDLLHVAGRRIGRGLVQRLAALEESAKLVAVGGERAVAALHPFPGGVEIDLQAHRHGVVPQRLADSRALGGAAPECDDGRRGFRERVDGSRGLEDAEVRLAAMGEELRDRPPLLRLQLAVEIDEGPTEPVRDLGAEGRLARAHEADEREVAV